MIEIPKLKRSVIITDYKKTYGRIYKFEEQNFPIVLVNNKSTLIDDAAELLQYFKVETLQPNCPPFMGVLYNDGTQFVIFDYDPIVERFDMYVNTKQRATNIVRKSFCIRNGTLWDVTCCSAAGCKMSEANVREAEFHRHMRYVLEQLPLEDPPAYFTQEDEDAAAMRPSSRAASADILKVVFRDPDEPYDDEDVFGWI